MEDELTAKRTRQQRRREARERDKAEPVLIPHYHCNECGREVEVDAAIEGQTLAAGRLPDGKVGIAPRPTKLCGSCVERLHAQEKVRRPAIALPDGRLV